MEIIMKLTLDQAAIHLERGEVFTLRDAIGASVRVVRGSAWLTQEHDPQDYILKAGESFVIDRRGLTVVNGLTDASVSVLDGSAAQHSASLKVFPRALPVV